MKYVICGIVICLFIADIFIFLDLKRFLKKHESESVDINEKGLMLRAVAMMAISAFVALAGILIHFVK